MCPCHKSPLLRKTASPFFSVLSAFAAFILQVAVCVPVFAVILPLSSIAATYSDFYQRFILRCIQNRIFLLQSY
jgi:hypothetical protein